MTIVGRIIDYEQGTMTLRDVAELFCDLRNTGVIYTLQGHYHRTWAELTGLGIIALVADRAILNEDILADIELVSA